MSSLYGCASIVEGTSQTLIVDLSPKEATCDVKRKGVSVATISGSNRSLNVSKSKDDLLFTCNAPGYKEQFVKIESSASGWGVVGCIFIDLCITDYSTGALNKYPENADDFSIALGCQARDDQPAVGQSQIAEQPARISHQGPRKSPDRGRPQACHP